MARHRKRGQGKVRGIKMRDIERSGGIMGIEYLGMTPAEIELDYQTSNGLLDHLYLEAFGELDNDQPSLLIYEDDDWYDLKARRRLISRKH